MGRPRRQPEPEVEQGAPEWMVTFSDCMTLLLTFFVLLLSFSSFDEQVFKKLEVIFSAEMSTITKKKIKDKASFMKTTLLQQGKKIKQGSEKATLITGDKKGSKKESDFEDFRRKKVFSVPSKDIFWGRGSVMTAKGQKILSTVALYLKEMPNKIVISENAQGMDDETGKRYGLHRAWVVMNHLVDKHNVDKAKFSISATSTIANTQASDERNLEIVLLERSICN
ncbi:MAG: hypothetical protein FVQ80_05770 [Planctomycetes bacterium]|nr:hypothetical protein [Planctomycetota bacterium]